MQKDYKTVTAVALVDGKKFTCEINLDELLPWSYTTLPLESFKKLSRHEKAEILQHCSVRFWKFNFFRSDDKASIAPASLDCFYSAIDVLDGLF